MTWRNINPCVFCLHDTLPKQRHLSELQYFNTFETREVYVLHGEVHCTCDALIANLHNLLRQMIECIHLNI